MAVTRRQLTLRDFVQRRLGRGSDLQQLKRMFSRSFGAGSFAGFWRYWNPVYSYYLDQYCYRPLRKVLPRSLAIVATFACSGFLLHDLPFWWGVRALVSRSLPVPFVTLWFTLMAVLTLGGARLGLDYTSQPFCVRAVLNVLHIVAGALLAHGIAVVAS
ncbi:MAG: MBOAT family O-acyltransferase [Chloroflexota bacterium]